MLCHTFYSLIFIAILLPALPVFHFTRLSRAAAKGVESPYIIFTTPQKEDDEEWSGAFERCVGELNGKRKSLLLFINHRSLSSV